MARHKKRKKRKGHRKGKTVIIVMAGSKRHK